MTIKPKEIKKTNRRGVLTLAVLGLALFAGVLMLAQAPVATNVGYGAKKAPGGRGVELKPDQKIDLAMKIKQPFTVVAVGDLLEFQPFSKMTDPDIQAVVSVVQKADLAIADLENELRDFDNFGMVGGNLATKEVADDFANMGFKIVSRANNKQTDGPSVWEDFRQVERVGIVHVGVAHSLAEARMARFVQLPKGLVGEVGISSDGGTEACCSGGTVVPVTAAQLGQVKAMKDALLARRDEIEVPVAMPAPDPDGTVNVFGVTFTTGAQGTDVSGRGGRGRGGRGGAQGGSGGRAARGGGVEWFKNSLKVTQFHGVTAPQMAQLRAIAGDTGTGSDLVAFGTQFRLMDRPGEHSFDMDPQDLKEILTQIKTGKEASDFLASNFHWHQNRYDFQAYSYDHFPADFEIKFAHMAIDQGDDLFAAQGVHTIKGVEIYKGKPIFYGLSNFAFQSGLMPRAKGEIIEPLFAGQSGGRGPGGPGPAEDGAGGRAGRGGRGAGDVAEDPNAIVGEHETQGFWQLLPNLEALMAQARYEDGKLAEVRLYPLDLGQTPRPMSQVGIPKRPTPAVAKKILDELIEYSKPFGTKIVVEDGVAVIRIPPGDRK